MTIDRGMSSGLFKAICDDDGLRLGLEASLRIAGCGVETAAHGQIAIRRASHSGFGVILLELIPPRKDGLAGCEELRANSVNTPVVLLARIQAVVRRSHVSREEHSPHACEVGDMRVDMSTAAFWRGNKRLRLSMMEYALLQYFVRQPEEVLDRQAILEEIWGSDPGIRSRTVDVHIAWLRNKIGDGKENPRWIRTVRGKGYSFVSG